MGDDDHAEDELFLLDEAKERRDAELEYIAAAYTIHEAWSYPNTDNGTTTTQTTIGIIPNWNDNNNNKNDDDDGSNERRIDHHTNMDHRQMSSRSSASRRHHHDDYPVIVGRRLPLSSAVVEHYGEEEENSEENDIVNMIVQVYLPYSYPVRGKIVLDSYVEVIESITTTTTTTPPRNAQQRINKQRRQPFQRRMSDNIVQLANHVRESLIHSCHVVLNIDRNDDNDNDDDDEEEGQEILFVLFQHLDQWLQETWPKHIMTNDKTKQPKEQEQPQVPDIRSNGLSSTTTTATAPTTSATTTIITIRRMLIYSHHIIGREKRRDMIQLTNDLLLTGICKIGWPGLLILEGMVDDCINFYKTIKRWQWQHLTLRGIIDDEVTIPIRHPNTTNSGSSSSSSGGSFPRLDICSPHRLFRNKYHEVEDMSVVASQCKSVGLELLFQTSMKIYNNNNTNDDHPNPNSHHPNNNNNNSYDEKKVTNTSSSSSSIGPTSTLARTKTTGSSSLLEKKNKKKIKNANNANDTNPSIAAYESSRPLEEDVDHHHHYHGPSTTTTTTITSPVENSSRRRQQQQQQKKKSYGALIHVDHMNDSKKYSQWLRRTCNEHQVQLYIYHCDRRRRRRRRLMNHNNNNNDNDDDDDGVDDVVQQQRQQQQRHDIHHRSNNNNNNQNKNNMMIILVILIASDPGSISNVLKQWRISRVDIDSRGKPCLERQMTLLIEGPILFRGGRGGQENFGTLVTKHHQHSIVKNQTHHPHSHENTITTTTTIKQTRNGVVEQQYNAVDEDEPNPNCNAVVENNNTYDYYYTSKEQLLEWIETNIITISHKNLDKNDDEENDRTTTFGGGRDTSSSSVGTSMNNNNNTTTWSHILRTTVFRTTNHNNELKINR